MCSSDLADTLARATAQRLSEVWGQQVLVENKPGANTAIGAEYVAKSPADGYTVLMIETALVINPSLYAKLPYDTFRDFAPVAGLVAITPAAGFLLPGPALGLGLVAGAVCFWACTMLKQMLRYDDSLDAFGVHGVAEIGRAHV